MAEINLIKEETIQVDLTNESTIDAQVTDINYIPAYKVAEEERRKNEIERVSNENERIEYYEEVRRDVENGEFDGKNTVYVCETEPTDDFYEVWINPEGTPTVEAENIIMEDGETLQDKYENGELKGPKGDMPDLTDYATKEYVENEIATFDFIKVVDTLPETGLENRIYFVPKADTQTQDLFDEYVWINGKWEWVTTKQLEVDLTPYYKKTETYNKTEVDNKINVINVTEAGTNLDDYIKTGTYYFRGADVIPTNIPAGSNGWLVVLEGTSDTHIKQIWYRLGSEGNHYQTYIRTRLSGVWSEWQRMVVFNDIYYENGDTYEIGAAYEIINGFVSSGSGRLYLDFKVPKSLSKINSFTVNKFHIRNLRGVNGYILQDQTEVEFKVTPYIINENTIEVVVENTDGTAFNATNNTLICAEILNTKFTFNE